jgi:hypothetical protein
MGYVPQIVTRIEGVAGADVTDRDWIKVTSIMRDTTPHVNSRASHTLLHPSTLMCVDRLAC